MPSRATHLLIAVFTVGISLSAFADDIDTSTLRAEGESALALNDCAAMIRASRLLKPAAERNPDSEEAAVRDRLTDAMLALPNCGESRFQLLRSRSLKSGTGSRPSEWGARR